MPSRRQERVAKRVVQELTEALRNLKNVNLGFITVTRCEISPDLRHAKVFVSVWGTDEEQERALSLIRQHASRLRKLIARPLGIKVTPDLHFEFDESIATADRISRLIRDARESDVNPGPLSPEEEAALAAMTPSSENRRFPADSAAFSDDDPFETARREVEEELLGDLDDDPEWRPINLDDLPDDED